MFIKKNIIFLLSFLLCGCASFSESRSPAANYLNISEIEAAEKRYETKWWEGLNDPAINILIEKTFLNNPTLDQVSARIDEAKAQLGISKSGKFPTIGINSGITRNYDGSLETGKKSQIAAIGPNLSWEIDLFGRIRNSRKVAENHLNARIADAQNTRIILASSVAKTVLDYRACRYSSIVLEMDIASRKETISLIEKKIKAGFGAQIDKDSATAALAITSIELSLQKELSQKNLNALSALSGMDKTELQEMIRIPAFNEIEVAMPEPPQISEVIEAKELMNNPGVRAAFYDAEAARADIDVTKTERLPRLDLAGVLTGQWLRATGTTIDFTTRALGATVSGNIFDGGFGKSNVDASEARYLGALASLESAFRTAVQEAQDALSAQQSANERHEAAKAALKAAQSSLNANESMWKNGLVSLLELEESHRQLLTSQINLITARRDQAAAWIDLYRVLGKLI
jgi:outer membrane protein, multidrug efflux system